MDNVQVFIEIIKFILPAIMVFFTAYFVLKNQGDSQLSRLRLEVLKQNQNVLTPIKLQAYERMTLFLERISPIQLLQTHNQQDMSGKALKHILLTTIQNEYNYNLSQQIYMSSQAWNLIKVVKEQVIKLIQEASAGMPEQATSNDLSGMIVEYLKNHGEQPTDKAIQFIKAEIELMFGK
ncbi:MAG: hypothetical protein EBV15_06740 [Bacteroidetes bacterium]|jgi:hypothetical protein|nr:hypothetical protein [Bacteroidota bacterium]